MASPTKLTAIYSLADADGIVRYIGKTGHPKTRLADHVRSGGRPTPVACWCRKLRAVGVRPVMQILEWVEDWEAAERKWIAHHREIGSPLLNVAAGGLDMAHTAVERGKYPAYAWMTRYFARIGRKDYGAALRDKAAQLRAEFGSEGMAGFDAYLRGLLRDTFPLAVGAR